MGVTGADSIVDAAADQAASPLHKRVDSAEAHTLKRGRAESVEPPVLDQPELSSTSTKKNRLALSTGQQPSKPMDPPDQSPNIDLDQDRPDNNGTAAAAAEGSEDGGKGETKNVGEVRRKVEKMTYEEGGNGAAASTQTDVQEVTMPEKGEEEGPNSAMSLETRMSDPNSTQDDQHIKTDVDEEEWQTIDKSEAEGADKEITAGGAAMEKEVSSGGQEGLKRKVGDRSESSYNIDKELGQAKRQKDTPSPSEEPPKPLPAASTDTQAAPPKKQTTFSSFSSTASPFANSARTSSPFASAGSNTGSSSATPSAFASASKPNAFASSGFGNYSSTSSPFAKQGVASPFGSAALKYKVAGGDKDASGGSGEGEESAGPAGTASGSKTKPSSFGDILQADAGEKTEEEKVHMSEQDVKSGEEDEDTVYSVRTKLYVMQADGGWRERGVGTLKLNVRRSDGKGARLVMRAEGVLRLILNVSLYVGMSCLEDGKHVRTTVIEDGDRRFLTFRTGSNKVAAELSNAIHDHIPLESTSASASKSPDPDPEKASAEKDAAEEV